MSEKYVQKIYGEAVILAAEIEEGNCEYKFKLTNLNAEQLQHRITQLNWRLNEGNDEAIYQLGVEDDGYPRGISESELEASLMNLQKMADAVGCSLIVRQLLRGAEGITAEVLLRRLERQILRPVQIQVALIGDVDCGKSTLIGVLSSGKLDNGKGLARMQVFQHNHEVCTGRTSSVSQHNIYFSVDGKVLNNECSNSAAVNSYSNTITCNTANRTARLRSRSELELADITARIVSFIDLAGHQKYLKTTVQGLISHAPDHCLICVSAKRGIQSMTSEHLGVACALRIPIVIAITKVDTVHVDSVMSLVDSLKRLLSNSKRSLVLVNSQSELELIKDEIATTISESSENDSISKPHVVPIFLVSNVNGQGLDLIRFYFFHLSSQTKSWSQERKGNPLIRILGCFSRRNADVNDIAYNNKDEDSTSDDDRFSQGIEENGTKNETVSCKAGSQSHISTAIPLSDVLTKFSYSNSVFLCMVQSGTIRLEDRLLLGPFSQNGNFLDVSIRSLRVNNVPVRSIDAGQCATITLAESIESTENIGENFSVDLSCTKITDSTNGLLAPKETTNEDIRRNESYLLETSTNWNVRNSSSNTLPRMKRRTAAGLVMVAPDADIHCMVHWEFDVELFILNHPSKIRPNYQPVVHVGCVQQSAQLVKIMKRLSYSNDEGNDADAEKYLLTGDKALCRFRFLYHPEYLAIGSDILIREGRTRGVGKVVQTYCNITPSIRIDKDSETSTCDCLAQHNPNSWQQNEAERFSDVVV